MSTLEKINIGFITMISILLFVALSQPLWNSKHLIDQTTSDCKARGGVLIVDRGTFGDTYGCESWLGK